MRQIGLERSDDIVGQIVCHVPGLNDQTGERAPVVDWLPAMPALASILSRLAAIVGILPIV